MHNSLVHVIQKISSPLRSLLILMILLKTFFFSKHFILVYCPLFTIESIFDGQYQVPSKFFLSLSHYTNANLY